MEECRKAGSVEGTAEPASQAVHPTSSETVASLTTRRALEEEVWVGVFMLSRIPLGFVVLLLCFGFKKVCLRHCYDFHLDFSLLFATSKSTQAVADNHLLTRMERAIHL